MNSILLPLQCPSYFAVQTGSSRRELRTRQFPPPKPCSLQDEFPPPKTVFRHEALLPPQPQVVRSLSGFSGGLGYEGLDVNAGVMPMLH